MASISGNTSWMTSFFFEQDLRSQYMNGVLNAGLKPGIYNPNICLYTRDAISNTELTKDANGVNLFIRKGTTFVFSNNYEKTHGSGCNERNLNNVGTYMIKCFAMEDIVVNLINASTTNDTAVDILGTGSDSPACPLFYIVASIMYNPDDSTGESIPEFRCVVPNYNYDSDNVTSESHYFNTAGGSSVWQLPDGSGGSLETSKRYISYLMVGAVKDVTATNIDSTSYRDPKIYYMASKGDWKSAVDGNSGSTGNVLWSQNHVFIGRGLQEYRQSLTANKNVMSPELIPCPNLNSFVLDIPNTFINDVLIDKPAEYSRIWNIRGKDKPPLSDFELNSKLSNQTDLRSPITNANNGKELLVWDFYFLNSRSRYSELEDLDNLFNDYNLKADDLSIIHESFVTELEINSVNFMNPSYDKEEDAKLSNVEHWDYLSDETSPAKEYLKGKKLIPLDVNDLNRDRLFKLIKNKSIIPQVINYMRKNNKLNIKKTTTLLPLAIAFRKVSKNAGELENNGKSVDDIGYLSNDDTLNRVHPCNILSLLDLQYKTSQINVSTIKSQDIYSVLPVQE